MECPYCHQNTVSDASTEEDPYPCMNQNCFGQEYAEDPKALRRKIIHQYGRSAAAPQKPTKSSPTKE